MHNLASIINCKMQWLVLEHQPRFQSSKQCRLGQTTGVTVKLWLLRAIPNNFSFAKPQSHARYLIVERRNRETSLRLLLGILVVEGLNIHARSVQLSRKYMHSYQW